MSEESGFRRRTFLAATGAATLSGLAGCSGMLGSNSSTDDRPGIGDFRGSGAIVQERPAPGGESIADLPDLEGELSIYLGGGEGGRYVALIDLINQYYDDFSATQQTQRSSQLANNIVTEYENDTMQADVFWSIDAGSLAYVASNGATRTLSSGTRDPVLSEQFTTEHWVGLAGRSRAVPYNTNQFSESDIPNSVDAFTTADRFQGTLGWAPTYGAFQGFVTAMRQLRGDEATREWLTSMRDQAPTRYRNEYQAVSEGITNGEVGAGLTNHYYPMLVFADRPDAPLDLAFTQNDASSLVNTAGASVLKGADDPELAELYIRHLLSAEAQEFLATRGFAFPMIDGVDPVGPLPSIAELSPPEIDLQSLSDVQPTVKLLKDVGILS
ncbi:iron ABC transporter substrate-binding protein [Halobacterium salinarum]|uniref:ABC-type transport system periplasmicsubstrate-binding protein n=3 Tax=Halobacterium salinarum TaxID=2242 RepID=Q9HR04_HALSA|nr:iron ABC transporter substrate-binding protein [Halobacterium salinarum]AAG19355.1 iron-binding protein [Halobacterium salinarum NRC-1]MBB6090469.1 iron(III) transport system substrate-binding protein [Halobacterium salinarum]MDL0130789.1 iron ABC transporter substrate-binding protein [Halobacterium salinarum]MDL0141990.1 iron ABC transporter substrate-binding protein [Halobacterium salinarum]UEB92776.1 iron ABC transporter substrate-binding protein [Halobacterium salinarum NRC-34001]